MIELFAHKQICCEHCGFGFFFTEFGSAAKIVCPACGEENVPPSLLPPVSAKPDAELNAAEPLPEFPDPLLQSAETPALCSVEHCPLLTGNTSGNAVAEQMGLHLLKKKRRRRIILAWTVTLQVCVLLGTILFVAHTLRTPDEIPVTNTTAHVETESPREKTWTELSVPKYVAPLPAEPGVKTARDSRPDIEPTTRIAESEHVPPPKERANHTFSPPGYDYPPPVFETPITAPDMLAAHSDYTPALLPAEETLTLEMADDLLESAVAALATDPEISAEHAVRAAKIYAQLGQTFPDSLYWILGNAFTPLSWGEPLLESSPAVVTATLSSDSRYLLAQLSDMTVWLWDLHSSEGERSGCLLARETAEYIKFVFSPDLRWIIGGQKNGTIRVWDMFLQNPAETVITLAERIPDLQDLQISPNGHWLAAFGHAPNNLPLVGKLQPIQQVSYQRPDRLGQPDSPPYSVLVWNLRQMEAGVGLAATPVPAMPQPVQVIRFSPNSDRLAVGSKDAVVRVYELTARGISDEPFVLQGHQLGITQMAFAPNGQWLATGSQDNTVRLWNLTSSKLSPESATLYGHLGWISALTIDSTGEYILSGSYDRTIRIWNVKRDRIGTALNTKPVVLETKLGVPESLAVTQDGDKMIALGNEGNLGIYHLPSLLGVESEGYFRAVTFRDSRLSVSKCLLTADDQFLIFCYEHLSNPANSGIRLWALQPQGFVQ